MCRLNVPLFPRTQLKKQQFIQRHYHKEIILPKYPAKLGISRNTVAERPLYNPETPSDLTVFMAQSKILEYF